MDYNYFTPPKRPKLIEYDFSDKIPKRYRNQFTNIIDSSTNSPVSSKQSLHVKESPERHSEVNQIYKDILNIDDLMIDERDEEQVYSWYYSQKQEIFQPNEKYPKFKREYDFSNQKRFHPKINFDPDREFEISPLKNDFYLNLIDIHGQSSLIAIGYHDNAIIYNTSSKKFDQFKVCQESNGQNRYLTCLKFWEQSEHHIGISDNKGNVSLWDYEKLKQVSHLKSFGVSISSIDWQDPHLLTVAGKPNIVYNLDTRQSNHIVQQFQSGHTASISSLKWNRNKQDLITGGKDSQISCWNCHKDSYPVFTIKNAHKSSIKALNWSSLKSSNFISGGGIEDGMLKLWDCHSQRNSFSVNVQSQITNILPPQNFFEGYFMVTCGNPSNSVEVWLEQTNNILKKKMELEGYKNKALYSAISPYNDQIITTSYDGPLKIWDLFIKNPSLCGGKNKQPFHSTSSKQKHS